LPHQATGAGNASIEIGNPKENRLKIQNDGILTTLRNALALAAALSAVACSHAPPQPEAVRVRTVAISSIIEVPPLLQARDGVVKALADRGFVEGKNLAVRYRSANGSGPAQQEIAKAFASERADVIVAISTPTAQAMQAAAQDTPIVFAAVTDPVKAKLIKDFGKPTGNVTGVSDIAPLQLQLQLFRELVPGLKRLGFIYNPQLASPVSTLEALRRVSEPLGITIVESHAPSGNDVITATNRLVGQVDAIYVPNDTTVNPMLESVVKIGRDSKTPLFTGETSGVERGALASVGLSYFDIGRLAGNMAADILGGKAVRDVDAVLAHQKLTSFLVVVNKGAASAIGVTVPPSVIARATKVVE
jgi:putative ABC transport system substrate-binding protein